MEAPPSTLNNLSTHLGNKPSVYDPVDRMTSNSRLIESKAFDKSTATAVADSLLSTFLL